MAWSEHLRVFSATRTILPAFCYVCGPGKVFLLYSRTLRIANWRAKFFGRQSTSIGRPSCHISASTSIRESAPADI